MILDGTEEMHEMNANCFLLFMVILNSSVFVMCICIFFTDIDECVSSPCANGQCQDEINQYTCMCDPGWTGENCDMGEWDAIFN